jgi:Protein of unknown function (DUF2914)
VQPELPPVASDPLLRSGAPPRTRAEIVSVWFDRLAPWVSLAVSLWSAASMDRDEAKSPWIVGFAALGFVALSATTLAHRRPGDAASNTPTRFHRLLRFTTMAGSQSLVQGALLFSAPFYVQAAAYTWAERCLLHPLLGPVLLAFSSFAAWNVALPMLGVPHGQALWITATLVSVGVPGLMYVADRGRTERRALFLVLAALPFLFAAFGATLLPAAPLKVVELGIGTAVVQRRLVGAASHMASAPPNLFCLSAIFEPHALGEGVVHVWSHDGEELFRIELAVRGGRKRGFRTWSRLPLSAHAQGRYRCAVMTSRGQTLALSEVHISRGQ